MVLNSPFTKTLNIDLPHATLEQSLKRLPDALRGYLLSCSTHFAPNKTTDNSQVVHQVVHLFLVDNYGDPEWTSSF